MDNTMYNRLADLGDLFVAVLKELHASDAYSETMINKWNAVIKKNYPEVLKKVPEEK